LPALPQVNNFQEAKHHFARWRVIQIPIHTDIDVVEFTREQIDELFAGQAAEGKKGPNNRRSWARTPMGRQIEVTIRGTPDTGDRMIEGWLHDLSMEGLGLVTSAALNVGDRLSVMLGMPRQPIEYLVKRCSPLPRGMFTVGCTKLATVAAKTAAPKAGGH
jgi:hypothetical protein